MGNYTINPDRYRDEDWKRPPEETLSLLVESRLGVAVDPAALREFIFNNWHRVSTLAHRIHDIRRASIQSEAITDG